MEKINILISELKKELAEDRKIWTIKFRHNNEEKTGECFSKTQPVLGEQEAESVTLNTQYNRWDVKLAKPAGQRGAGGGGKFATSPEERKAEREQISRNSGLNYAIQMFNGGKLDVPEGMKATDAIIAGADKFSRFILTGEIPKKQQ